MYFIYLTKISLRDMLKYWNVANNKPEVNEMICQRLFLIFSTRPQFFSSALNKSKRYRNVLALLRSSIQRRPLSLRWNDRKPSNESRNSFGRTHSFIRLDDFQSSNSLWSRWTISIIVFELDALISISYNLHYFIFLRTFQRPYAE